MFILFYIILNRIYPLFTLIVIGLVLLIEYLHREAHNDTGNIYSRINEVNLARLLCTPLFVLKGINALISTTETYIVSELGNSPNDARIIH